MYSITLWIKSIGNMNGNNASGREYDFFDCRDSSQWRCIIQVYPVYEMV
jgi:hypothetical protein